MAGKNGMIRVHLIYDNACTLAGKIHKLKLNFHDIFNINLEINKKLVKYYLV